MSRIISEPEKICVCETEQNLNIILSNLLERQSIVADLELFLDSLIEMMKKYVFYGGEKLCYQWIYAMKTKEIVDKIKELNSALRAFQKNASLMDKTRKHIDDVLRLEKVNFDGIISIFNLKMNFLRSFENGNENLNKKFEDKANGQANHISNEKLYLRAINQRILDSQVKIESLEKELSELITNQIEIRRKLHFKIIEIKPTNF